MSLLHVGGMEDLLEVGLCRAYELSEIGTFVQPGRSGYHDVLVLLWMPWKERLRRGALCAIILSLNEQYESQPRVL